MNKLYWNRLIDPESKMEIARWVGAPGLGERGEKTKKQKSVFTKYSWGCKVRHRQYSK